MGGLAGIVKRMLLSIIPVALRTNGGVYLTALPHGAGALGAAAQQLTADTAVTYKYGAVAAVMSATANTVEGWAEGVVLSQATTAAKEWWVAVTQSTAITAAAQVLGEVGAFLALTTSCIYLPFPQRVYLAPNAAIGLAIASSVANKKASAWLVVSRNK